MRDLSETLSNLAAEIRTRNELNDRFVEVLDKIIAAKDAEAERIAGRTFRLNLLMLAGILLLAGTRVAEILGYIR